MTSKPPCAGTTRSHSNGLWLTLIHLISIPVTNTSVNPERRTGVAVYVGGWAVAQLWLFWVAPIVGARLRALAYRGIAGKEG
jgi:aquaporin Z